MVQLLQYLINMITVVSQVPESRLTITLSVLHTFERIFKINTDKLERVSEEKNVNDSFQFEAIPALRPLCFQAVRLAPVQKFHSDLGRFWYNPPGIALCIPLNEDLWIQERLVLRLQELELNSQTVSRVQVPILSKLPQPAHDLSSLQIEEYDSK
jgi:hypothetical protein